MTERQGLSSREWAERAAAGRFVPAATQVLLDEIERLRAELTALIYAYEMDTDWMTRNENTIKSARDALEQDKSR